MFFFSALVTFIGLGSCSSAPIDQRQEILGKEIILNGEKGSFDFEIEIADTASERAKGLSGRQRMPDNHGMLFIFDKPDRHVFWMKDTYLSLDIIFFDNDFKVVGIIENTTPMSLSYLEIDANARYVLEVLAGTVKKHGINLHTTARVRY